ncbi:DUF1330 domain-containing protein [Ideonella sp. 4Y11]|uniref:DUF1330 domain-containing protein n=1 Tax=Ideonella aquatica TaxID=2824119 RepID=A0A941BH88_9BURK|nr:DUF1330 domain-containing protein [Ideonella aquatica]MBQ0960641.1 DUF1330 domain-containing protein [Ideonella aquatica]
MPAAYVIADVTVTDEQKMAEYRQWSSRAMAEHGAEIVVRGGAPAVMEGDWAPTRIVVLKFAAGRAAAQAFYDSQTYTQARQVREGAGVMRMIVVDGPE